jgi:hypothetical protein
MTEDETIDPSEMSEEVQAIIDRMPTHSIIPDRNDGRKLQTACRV